MLTRAPKSSEKPKIGVVISHVAYDSFFNYLLHGIEDELLRHDASMMLKLSHRDPDREHAALRQLNEAGCAALILYMCDPGASWRNVSELLDHDKPLVLLDHRLPGMDDAVDTVVSDNIQDAFMAARHLIELGHRWIAMLSSRERFSSVIQREEGFRLAMTAAGLTSDPAMSVLVSNAPTHIKAGADAATRLLDIAPRPTAVLALNDAMAIGAIRLLKSRGIRVPADISVIGFDDLKEVALLEPALTTVRQDKEGMGRRAVALLMDRLRRQDRPARHEMLATALVIRASTTAPCAAAECATN